MFLVVESRGFFARFMRFTLRKTTALAVLVLVPFVLTACSMPRLPSVHRVVVQQGNVINQNMIDQLKPGMTRSQVAYIMGEPVIRNTFNEKRWDYVYTFELPGRINRDMRMSLYFENDVLAYFTGDFAPTEETQEELPETETADASSAQDSSNES